MDLHDAIYAVATAREEDVVVQCMQCGRPALIRIVTSDEGVEIRLCLDCNIKWEHARTLEFERLVVCGNYAAAEFELISGMPVPRYQMPPSRVVHVAGMTTNNIRIDRSNIGTVNTGTIETLDSSVTILRQSGQGELAYAVRALTEAVAASTELARTSKDEILELLSFVASEASASRDSRKSAAARRVLQNIANLIQSAAGLAGLWAQYGPALSAAFS